MSDNKHQVPVTDPGLIKQSIAVAVSRIAPNWPLDQMIAVNPYWGWSDLPFSSAAQQLWKLSAAPLTMPRSYFSQQWEQGLLSVIDLRAALALADDSDARLPEAALLSAFSDAQSVSHAALLVTELIDLEPDHAVPWQQFVKHQISQHCAAYFDQSQARWRPDQELNLYASWQWHTKSDLSPLLQLGMSRFKKLLQKLPDNAHELIATLLPAMGLKSQSLSDYLTALLLDIHGWAAWCTYQQWQAQLVGTSSEQVIELLAIRLAWDWLLLDQHPHCRETFLTAWHNSAQANDAHATELQINQILLHALEHAFQQPLAQQLLTRPTPQMQRAAAIQAVFCIDVRSEVLRRALEAAEPGIDTLGFAGFFGLPIAYRSRGSALIQPQMPGLLAPSYWVSETEITTTDSTRQALLDQQHWQELRLNPSSGFTFVESLGLKYVHTLIKQSLPAGRRAIKANAQQSAAPLTLYADPELSVPVTVEQQSQLAKQILTTMGMTEHFARLFLICGHGAACVNNAHAAGLACGACGGQSGAINARLLAGMLNNPSVRALLQRDGLTIPDNSWFIAGLHNTTTDAVELFDVDQVPTSHQADLQTLQTALASASQATRLERAAALGMDIKTADPDALAAAFTERSNDWSQIRPEWALANNAALIIGPRSRSRGINLAGRSFLNEYQWSTDIDFVVLERIMTAPLLVANWINMQYYASTVDNQRMGSGSKLLHNVVGQRLGVFEGNGGDLRIGLPWQSVHDGQTLRHTPLRLSVFIEAPRAAIDAVIAKHPKLSQLVDNHWLHLFQIESQSNEINYRRSQNWTLFAS